MKLYFKIRKTPACLFDYLTNMQKFASVHPVITKIDKTGPNGYLVYESLKVGFIPLSFTYPVIIEPQRLANKIKMTAKVMKLIKIEMSFRLQGARDFTIVEEDIIFKSPLPVGSIMENIFKKQHRQLFKNIEIAD